MTLLRFFIIFAVVGACAHCWNTWHEQRDLDKLRSSNGFLPVPMPAGSALNTVIVFTPLNCPKAGAQRANAIVKKLTDLGIPNVKSDHYGSQTFVPSPEILAGFKRLNVVMTGEIPVVLVNGMGKANPSIDEVVAEYKRTQ